MLLYNCIDVVEHINRPPLHQRIHITKVSDATHGAILEVARMRCGSQEALDTAARAGRVDVPCY